MSGDQKRKKKTILGMDQSTFFTVIAAVVLLSVLMLVSNTVLQTHKKDVDLYLGWNIVNNDSAASVDRENDLNSVSPVVGVREISGTDVVTLIINLVGSVFLGSLGIYLLIFLIRTRKKRA